jgi:uncharacterized protein DUF4012
VSQRRHRRRWILIVLGILVLLALEGIWAAVRAEHDLTNAKASLQSSVDAVLAGDLPKADSALVAALDEAKAAAGFRSHPAIWIASQLPWLGDNVDAVEALSQAITTSAEAGRGVVASAQQTGWSGSGLPGLSGRPIAQTKLQLLAPALETAGGALTQAAQGLEAVQGGHLVGPVRSAVETAHTSLTSDALLLNKATTAASLLPRMLADGSRYLFIVQNPDEPRGTGGFMGYYGFMDVQGGHLTLTKFFPADGKLVSPVNPPNADYKNRWARFTALQDLRQSNFEPDLPTTGKVILQMAKARAWGDFDGIIMVDPVWMQDMLAATGPITTPSWPDPITSENAVKVLAHDVFFVPDTNNNGNEDESNLAQGNIGQAVWTALQTRTLSPSTFASGVAASSAQRHLQIYLTDPKSEALVHDLGVDGATTLGKNPIYVTWAGLSANKIGYDQARSMTFEATLDAKGTANVTTTVTDKNNATAGNITEYYGDGTDFPVGMFVPYVSVYTPSNIDGVPQVLSSGPTASAIEKDSGRTVASGTMEIAAGKTAAWAASYTAPGAVTTSGDVHRYQLDFLSQPALAPIPLTITVHLPAGSQVISAPGAKVSGTTVTWTGSPVAPESFAVTYR